MSSQAKKEHLPDPLTEIAKARKKLNPQGAVARSPYCDVILSLRMQGTNYHAIERWLKEQGPEHRIPASTLCRNLKHLTLELPYAEQIAERWGGRIDLDLARELGGQIIVQRARVDNLVRREKEIQQGMLGTAANPRFHDRRIKGEIELLKELLKDLHNMMRSPLDAAKEALEADKLAGVKLTEDARGKLTELILSGDIKIGLEDGSLTRH